MQKSYSQSKFLELDEERQVVILVRLLKEIESSWEQQAERDSLLIHLRNYFAWIRFAEKEHPLLKGLAHLQFKISDSMSLRQMSLRQLLDLTVPLERYLNLSVRDEQFLKVTTEDRRDKKGPTFPLRFVLDHLRSAFNVGSLFRTAECLGVEHLYLVGYTPTPDDRSVGKTSMGTAKYVSWSSHAHMQEVIERLKRDNFQLVALETVEGAIPLQTFKVQGPTALFVGNERFGLDPVLLEQLDSQVVIPMLGIKNSLNVANSMSIAAFEILRQLQQETER